MEPGTNKSKKSPKKENVILSLDAELQKAEISITEMVEKVANLRDYLPDWRKHFKKNESGTRRLK